MSIVDSFQVTKLIDAVRQNRCIYDPRDPQHTNRAVVNYAWKLIAIDMGVPETICREKWANLRSNFARELRKARRKLYEDGPSTKPESQWLFYEAMGFLAPFVKSRLAAVGAEGEESLPALVKVEREAWWGDGSNQGGVPDTEPLCEILTKRSKTSFDTDDGDCESDDDRLFLLSLLPKMRRLSLPDNLSFRVAVQTLLMEKLLSHAPAQTQTEETDEPLGPPLSPLSSTSSDQSPPPRRPMIKLRGDLRTIVSPPSVNESSN